jgi:SAM-dependent methyltransferase
METCYKAVRTQLLKSIPSESNDFRIELELTNKLAKRRTLIFEVPISYSGRTYDEGKKINWRDLLRALLAIIKFALSDKIYQRDLHASHILARLSRTPKFNAWMADTIRGYCRNRVLEIGSGVGNLTCRLIPRPQYVASNINPLYLQTLKALSADRPYLKTTYCDITDGSSFPSVEKGLDTVICLNVIEHVDSDHTALTNLRNALVDGGTAIVLVPQGQWNFGTLDEVLGHQRRYCKKSLRQLAEHYGFKVNEILEFNRVGQPGMGSQWQDPSPADFRPVPDLDAGCTDGCFPVYRSLSALSRFEPYRGVGTEPNRSRICDGPSCSTTDNVGRRSFCGPHLGSETVVHSSLAAVTSLADYDLVPLGF